MITTNKIALHVKGMMCQNSCGRTVANAIQKVPGTKKVNVSFLLSNAIIEYEMTNNININDIIQNYINIIDDIGFEAILYNNIQSNYSFKIIGMMCQKNCATTIENAIRMINNVSWAIARYDESDLLVWGINKIEIQEIINKISEIGYEAILKQSNELTNEQLSQQTDDSNHKFAIIINDTINQSNKQSNNQINNQINTQKITKIENKIENKIIKNYIPKNLLIIKIIGMLNNQLIPFIETIINKINGIIRYKIILLNETIEIIYNTLQNTSNNIIEILKLSNLMIIFIDLQILNENDSYKQIMYEIYGMNCANCAIKIEKTIEKLNGIISVKISSMTNKCIIIINENEVNCIGIRDIMNIIINLGYNCEIIDNNNNNNNNNTLNMNNSNIKNETDIKKWLYLLIFALIFGFPIIIYNIINYYFINFHNFMNNITINNHFNNNNNNNNNNSFNNNNNNNNNNNHSMILCYGGITYEQIFLVCLSVPIQCIVGYKYYRSAYLSIIHNSYGMDLLIVIGTSVTLFYSLIRLCLSCVSHIKTTHVFIEESALLLMFVTIGKYLEVYAKGKTATAITDLLKLQPTTALLVQTNKQTNQLNQTNQTNESNQINDFNNNNNNKYNENYNENENEIENNDSTHLLAQTDNYESNNNEYFNENNELFNENLNENNNENSNNIDYLNINNYEIKEIKIEIIQKNDILKILPGARIQPMGLSCLAVRMSMNQ